MGVSVSLSLGCWDEGGLRNLPTGTWDLGAPMLFLPNSGKIVANRFLERYFPALHYAIPGNWLAQGSSGLRLKSLELKVLEAGTCIVLDKALVLICLLLQVRFPRAR